MTTTALVPAVERLPVPVNDLDRYIDAVNRIPLLEADQEQHLARELRTTSDLNAAQQLVISHLRFVVHIARGFSGYGLPLADLIQEGNVGLMKAVRRFDPELGVRLVSFAVHWIKAEIHEYVLRNWRIVKVATTKAQRKLFFNLRSARKHLNWLNNDEAEQIASDLGVRKEHVLEMEARLNSHDVAFDPMPGQDDDEGGRLSPEQYLSQEQQAFDPSIIHERENWEADTQQRLMQALDALDERSREIVMQRWLSESKATLQALAERYGISAERVRQLEHQAMKRLRATMA